jgi:hypothetical protein
MLPTELIAMIEAQADSLKAFSQYLQSCANIDDVRNMARFFKEYQQELDGGEMQTNEVLPAMMTKFAVRLATHDDLEAGEYTTADRIGQLLHWSLRDSEESELPFFEKLFEAIHYGLNGRYPEPHSRVSARESVIAFVKSLDAPAAQSAKRPPKSAARGHKKKAA